jgi:signal transduction histidine kinase
MLKSRTRILKLVLLSFLFYSQSLFAQDKVKNIVVFFALNANLPAYENILEGFKNAYSESVAEPANMAVEYLEIGSMGSEQRIENIINLYNKKYEESGIDLLILVGTGISQTVEKYDFKAMKKAPVISIDLDIPGRKPLKNGDYKNILEVILTFKAGSTLKEALDLFPTYKNVYIISGNSNIDLYFTSLIHDCKEQFEPAHHFIFITGITIDSTIQFVKKIPEASIIIVPSYLSDNKNISFSTPEALNLISYNSIAPVFPVTDSFIKRRGAIGGYLFSYLLLGKETGRIALEIFNGKRPEEITVNKNSFYQHIYDWQQLKKWNLLKSNQIPGNSIFYYKEISFFSTYQWYILGFLLFLISQTLLILYLYRLNKRQKVIAEKMLETETMHRELIREDRMAKMTELTASLSHELNQPLTAILYSAQAGKRFLKTDLLDSKQAEEIFDNIIEDDKRAGSIISSVKSLMKLETREKEKVNLNALIQETVDIMRNDLVRQKIKVDINDSPDPSFVMADKIQLQQVLMNFIRNAANALGNNESLNKVLRINLYRENNSAILSVSDNGPGIDENIINKIFKPFITTTKKGFGIGLALSRSIIESHQGEIWAENNPEGGAVFSFRINTLKDE